MYCGRNEGSPPESLNNAFRNAINQYDGTRGYVPDSSDGQVSGHGPYTAMEPEWYFFNSNSNFHTERGTPNVPALEAFKK